MKRQAPTRTHRQMVAAWEKDPEFKAAYDELDTEFALLRQLLAARRKAGLTQAGVAAKMGTRPPAVTRLETALSADTHSPTLATLKKYARAVGCKLEVHLVPSKAR
ncbi:MAG: helix-turn-helix domain-containing protein [Desulfobacteria bacterium]|nr:helix-turn-helix transcriptional regulator [Deltaproteobacteria bacterium]MDA8180656.1 helix-turn-helix transcriptional regulator [Deltaproteobacteria bacterium]HQT96650.1 helix-turn-helix transcriptional regulator [Thermodesulfobacteriota bacterium]